MKIDYLTKSAINQFIDAALQEDIGEGDHSTLAAIPSDLIQEAKLIIKGDGVIAGLELAQWIFHRYDENLVVTFHKADGDQVVEGEVGLTVKGSARSILSTERLVLNCMQRMSGIATYTRRLSDMIQHTETKLLDTRKTSPNFRICEKWAVKIGGGVNHRFGLYDMVMLKDNHNDYAGGITQAVKATQAYLKEQGKDLRIEVETRNLEEVAEALAVGGVDVIMLDNMLPSMMQQAVQMIKGKCQTEASGGVTELNIKEIAETGVDFISVGALTHSYTSLDISLKAVK
ncbi:carboxylating nicotinate-nucleotide diphosphorylase [Reichenbachiella agarivorans]|uniref:nicotinate-nucleotide diphosphorylase (carboxylating) n=1 Tax=Reichenbachiella agarivorans TaxID=2979464 RepID=A0ABY6CT35_9BACT|nr:carboxylating nicotinate-nucleotide diphosphorylase [Reichenbachiella agarivorans]UXP33014.1 carboxylating nicotinate-nucleotide diphosphorylase [Reichenbachiella agarivorans]